MKSSWLRWLRGGPPRLNWNYDIRPHPAVQCYRKGESCGFYLNGASKTALQLFGIVIAGFRPAFG